MDQNVNPGVAALVLVVFGALIGVAFWASGEIARHDGPTHLRADPNGNINILVHNHLVRHSPDGQYLSTYDIGKLGVESMVGDFAFLSDGSILIRRGQYSPGLRRGLAIYFRLDNPVEPVAESEGEGLVRCYLDTYACTPFGSDRVDFNEAFHLFIDWRTDDVYVADTSRHILRKYDRDGRSTGIQEKGFWFPNQLMLVDGALYVVDTNHHSVNIVDADSSVEASISAFTSRSSSELEATGSESQRTARPKSMPLASSRRLKFGEALRKINVAPGNSGLGDHVWPAFLTRTNDQWWVNLMGKNMAGGRIARFDADWKFLDSIRLPPEVDPGVMLPVGERVLVTDAKHDRVLQLDSEGKYLEDFESEGLRAAVEENAAQRSNYQTLYFGSFAVFGAGLLIGMIVAVKSSRDGNIASLQAATTTDAFLADHSGVEWIPRPRLIAYYFKIGGWMMIFFPLLLIGLMHKIGVLSEHALPMYLAFASFIPVGLMIFGVRRQKIGVRGKVLVLCDHRGRCATGTGPALQVSTGYVAIGDVVVALGTNDYPLFDRQNFSKNVQPMLAAGQKMMRGELLTLLLRVWAPQCWLVVTMLLMTVAIIWLQQLNL